jgi:hypothetical protein
MKISEGRFHLEGPQFRCSGPISRCSKVDKDVEYIVMLVQMDTQTRPRRFKYQKHRPMELLPRVQGKRWTNGWQRWRDLTP